jgi:hypothetical protein
VLNKKEEREKTIEAHNTHCLLLLPQDEMKPHSSGWGWLPLDSSAL